jgi:hypothetical protein
VGGFELFVEEHVEGVWGYCHGIVMKKMNVRLHELFLALSELQSDTDNATRSKSQHDIILKHLTPPPTLPPSSHPVSSSSACRCNPHFRSRNTCLYTPLAPSAHTSL